MKSVITKKKFVNSNDYQPLDWLCKSVFLNFKIFKSYTTVHSKLFLFRNKNINNKIKYLILNGNQLKTIKFQIIYLFKDHITSIYLKPKDEMIYLKTPKNCEKIIIKSTVKIFPEKNSSLEGFYETKKIYSTQCEPQGFRKITWFPDRPDNLSIFTVRIEANKSFKNLLCNGNLIKSGNLTNSSRTYVVWKDPFPKPSYLFAIVVGNLDVLSDVFLTKSNKEISLEIYTELGKSKNAKFAMTSLKKAMEWDENKYGLTYDLDKFMIVAVDHFNMGAMENKGLNIFNSKFILSDPNISTDDDFENIESIIAHEYFHNWTGNRVTCRDWFQLTLKEGLTVFRDQQFTSDMRNTVEKRIKDVILLRSNQFLEDSGPNKHSIRPERYLEINNFYTTTVYEKGAEVIRMISNYVGEKTFIKCVFLFLKKFDGMAVTCEDFINSIQHFSKKKINNFLMWYKQKGTINLHVKRLYRPDINGFEIEFRQVNKFSRINVPIPINLSFFDQKGLKKKFSFDNEKCRYEHTFLLNDNKKKILIHNLNKNCVPSLLRNFSAPINLRSDLNINELIHLLRYDDDLFNKWDITQSLFLKKMSDIHFNHFENAIKFLIDKGKLNDEFISLILTPPSYKNFQNSYKNFDPVDLYYTRLKILRNFYKRIEKNLLYLLDKLLNSNFERINMYNQRSLLRVVVDCLCLIKNDKGLDIASKFCSSDIMSLKLSGINICIKYNHPNSKILLENCYEEFKHNNITLEKWFQISSSHNNIYFKGVDFVKSLLLDKHFDYKNPNLLRAVIGNFQNNNIALFHSKNELGYKFITEEIIKIDKFNPQIASRLVMPLTNISNFNKVFKNKIKIYLNNIIDSNPSNDVYEVVKKSLIQ